MKVLSVTIESAKNGWIISAKTEDDAGRPYYDRWVYDNEDDAVGRVSIVLGEHTTTEPAQR